MLGVYHGTLKKIALSAKRVTAPRNWLHIVCGEPFQMSTEVVEGKSGVCMPWDRRAFLVGFVGLETVMRSVSAKATEDHPSERGGVLSPVYQSAHFQAVPCRDCNVPGYLILLPRSPSSRFSELGGAALAALGPTIATLEDAVLNVTECERIYLLRLSEGTKSIHFHVFPRTSEMAVQFRKEMKFNEAGLNGELLFYWARQHFKVASPAELSTTTLAVAERLRRSLGSDSP
jgi:diadenosine tetraphosphate (Ap4A) HIT family hydrolase